MADTKTELIESRINKDITSSMALAATGGTNNLVPQSMTELMEFAKMMAISGPCVRPQFRNNPGACLGISMQAMRWGMDPFAVSNKAYVTTSKGGADQIAYEAQLIHAVINLRAPLQKRLRPTYSGDGPTRKCKIVGYVKGEDEPFDYESPELAKIGVKNSPLWASDPDQQLFYYSTRAWARRHFPEILLGAYTPEEVQYFDEYHDPASDQYVAPPPRPKRGDFKPAETVTETTTGQTETQPVKWTVVTADGVETETEDAEEAWSTALTAISDAASRGEQALEEVWGLNATFLAALRDAGLGDMADGLNRTYGTAIDELGKQRVAERARLELEADNKRKAEEAAATAAAEAKRIEDEAAAKKADEAKKAEEAKKPAADAQKPPPATGAPAGAPSPAKETTAPTDAPAAAAKASAAPAAEPGQRKPPVAPMKSPLSTKKHAEWPAWIEWFLRQVKTAPAAEVTSLYNTYVSEIEFCEENRQGDHVRILAAFDDRRDQK